MNKKQINNLVARAQEIQRTQTAHPWLNSAIGEFSKIQCQLHDAAPLLSGDDPERARILVSSIYVNFIGRSNELPPDLLTEVFAAIIGYHPEHFGVSEIQADEFGGYRIYRNGEFQLSFGSKEKAIRYFIGMIGEPH